jgi:hypothetical protein
MTDREIKHSGIQNIGYIEREDGELILTNYDPDKPFYIFGQETMTPEEYERVVERMQAPMKMANEYFQRKYEELNPSEESGGDRDASEAR